MSPPTDAQGVYRPPLHARAHPFAATRAVCETFGEIDHASERRANAVDETTCRNCLAALHEHPQIGNQIRAYERRLAVERERAEPVASKPEAAPVTPEEPRAEGSGAEPEKPRRKAPKARAGASKSGSHRRKRDAADDAPARPRKRPARD